MERTFIRKAVEYSLNEKNVDQILTRSQYQFYGWPFDIFSLVQDTENGAIDGLIRIEDEGENKKIKMITVEQGKLHSKGQWCSVPTFSL